MFTSMGLIDFGMKVFPGLRSGRGDIELMHGDSSKRAFSGRRPVHPIGTRNIEIQARASSTLMATDKSCMQWTVPRT